MPAGRRRIKDEFSHLSGRQQRYYQRHKKEIKEAQKKYNRKFKRDIMWTCETCGKALGSSAVIAREHAALLTHLITKTISRSLLVNKA